MSSCRRKWFDTSVDYWLVDVVCFYNYSLYDLMLKWLIKKNSRRCLFKPLESSFVRLQGFEPWTLWLRVRCSTNWATSACHLLFLKCECKGRHFILNDQMFSELFCIFLYFLSFFCLKCLFVVFESIFAWT